MYNYYGNQNYGYNPYYAQNPAPQMQQAQNSGDDRIYVQGEGAAKAYLVASGNTVTLWDTERQSIYIKNVNLAGIPTIQRLDYTVAESAPQKTVPEYETRLKAMENSIENIKKRMSAFEGVKANEHEPNADDSGV